MNYLVLGSKPWCRAVFEEKLAPREGNWHFIGDRSELTVELVEGLQPRYLFFLHWSWWVPKAITDGFECVCFHMTDVPYGRGGSPLQNLLVRGHTETRLSALRMVEAMDAGPVYAKVELPLHGTAEEIYIRATHLAADMALRIAAENPVPVAQEGEPTEFKRRKPADSEIPAGSLDALYDFVRMLDADGYPNAFLTHAGYRFEFRRAALYHGRIEADVRITLVPADQEDASR